MASTNDLNPALPPHFGDIIAAPLAAASYVFHPAIGTVYDIGDAARFSTVVIDEDVSAAWVAEGDEIDIKDAIYSPLIIVPRKVAGLTIVSNEVVHASNASALDHMGNSIARSLARKIDAAFVDTIAPPADPSDPAGPAPYGLGNLLDEDACETVDPEGWTNLDPIADAIALIETEGGTATGILAAPDVTRTLSKLKASTGDNRPLLGVDATNGTQRQALGLPILAAPDLDAGTAWVVDAEGIMVVCNRDIEVNISHDRYFELDSVGVRATARLAFGFPTPGRLVHLGPDET